MEGGKSQSLNPAADSLLLRIRDIDHMFNAPAVDPLSMGLPEVLGISGAEYLLSQLRTRQIKLETVTLALPDGRIVPGLADQTQQAFRRFAEYRIKQHETSLRETRRRGWRATVVALILLSIFLTLASLLASEATTGLPSLLRRTLEYGFEITGWVMLWHPIELLVFEPFLLKDKIAALRKLAQLQVVIRTWNECDFSTKAA
jgi:hypothetical protein